MLIRFSTIAAVIGLVTAACSPSQTVYGPATGPTGQAIGFDQLRITDNRWRVSFTAGSDVSTARAEQLALRRAAELTVENGYDWFEVVDRRVESSSGRSPVRVGGSAGTSVGSRGYRASGVGLGVSLSPGQESRTLVHLEIITRHAPVPDAPNAYDARQLLTITG
jgi:flavin-binding protein dodecin